MHSQAQILMISLKEILQNQEWGKTYHGRVRNVNTGFMTKEQIKENQKEEDNQAVYTLGMEEREQKIWNTNPGPETYDLKGSVSSS